VAFGFGLVCQCSKNGFICLGPPPPKKKRKKRKKGKEKKEDPFLPTFFKVCPAPAGKKYRL
jgi:hypothetical protein